MSARVVAVAILTDVFAGASLTSACQQRLPTLTDSRDRAFAQELAYGVCRWHLRLLAVVDALLARPMRQRDFDLNLLLAVGLYQLLYTRVPQHAALAATVQGTVTMNKAWAKGLVNGVLRNFLRRRDSLLADLEHDPVTRWSMPRWLLDTWRQDWPDSWQEVARCTNEYPPLVLRINQRRTNRDQYLALLQAAGLQAEPVAWVEDAIVLAQATPVSEIPGFTDGLVSVQDAAAQLALPLLELGPGMRVLDACAAPGGKSCHILEREPSCRLLSLDIDGERVAQITDNFQRLGLQGEVCIADAAEPGRWWDGELFDRILLDAPCSGSGVIRRHPDIKVLRKQGDVSELAHRQTHLLGNLWPLLKNHGKLVYATCSILKEENAERLQTFAMQHGDVRCDPMEVPWGRPQTPGRQILPGDGVMDGFYYGCLFKSV